MIRKLSLDWVGWVWLVIVGGGGGGVGGGGVLGHNHVKPNSVELI